MIQIGILGYGGRMGQLIASAIEQNSRTTFVGGAVRTMKPGYDPTLITTKAEEVISKSDVVIDFSTADATAGHARLTASQGKAFVAGTTGLDIATLTTLKDASLAIPVLYASNTSLSLVVMKQLTTLAAKLLGAYDYDVAILDEHHRMKKDAPSGTAKSLGEAVFAGSGGKKTTQYSFIRAGNIVGEHEVSFVGNGEVIRLNHSVTDRRIFAQGALEAALWLHGKPNGYYDMEDVLGIEK